MSMHEITIVVSTEYLDRFDAILRASEALGLQVSSQLPGVGVIIGRIDDATVPELERLDGVAAVEMSRSYNLPPPEGDIQ